jgi:hypothetical protein
VQDVDLIWSNCLLYNRAGTDVAIAAERMRTDWESIRRRSGWSGDGFVDGAPATIFALTCLALQAGQDPLSGFMLC